MGGRFRARPMEQTFALFARMRGDFGTGQVVAARPTPDGIEVAVDAPRGRFTLRLAVDPAPPNLITDVSVAVGGGDGAGPEAAPGPLDAAARVAVIDSVARALERMYISADTGRALADRLRRREREGAYASLPTLAAFTSAVTDDMRSMNGDRHLGLIPPGGRRGPRRAGGGGEDAEQIQGRVLEGNVGYLRLRDLGNGAGTSARLAAVLDSLRGTAAMIVDLRGAPGGSAELANLVISHFTAPNLPSLHVVNRVDGTDEVRRTLAEVPGPRRTDVPLYVLVDRGSASAAEDVPFVLQNLGRATIVGERTAGAGRNNVIIPVGSGLTASISVSRVSDARTGREWEAVGIEPDLEVPSDDALEAARRAAVARR